MEFRDNCRYMDSHEWAKVDGDIVTVGISDYAQDSLGDIVFVEMPEVGAAFKKGESFGVVESVKAASDVYVPVSGEVVEINEALADTPETVNSEPFDSGWIIKIKASDLSEIDSLMDSSAYKTYTEGLEE